MLPTPPSAYVLGQTTFTGASSGTTQSTIHSGIVGDCGHVSIDPVNSRLFLADIGNSRVMVFNVDPHVIANGENAAYVLGQADFVSSGTATTQSGLNKPDALMYDPGTHYVYVGDTQNNRVMVFDGTSLPAADYYLP